ncbi:hypothetical protein BC830DRAFT_424735 [Chytriomyces sp. MP71]|nr:hypothetical protein BC830DRAFT_424735 [Chytriomyces sp. MP71]
MRRGQKPEAKAPTLATSQEGPPSQYGHTPRQKLIPPISMWHDIRVSLIDKLIALLLDSPSAAVEWTPVDLNGLQLERKVHEPIEVAPAQSTRGKLERRIITALLHFVVAQFGVTVDSHCAKQGSTSEIVGASIPQTCTVPKKPIPTKPASNARSRGSNRTSTRNQTTSSKSQASSLQPPACARLQAARAFVSALQYASYLDCTGQSQEVLRTQEIKLLCLVSLASLCKQLDADKLRCLFSLNSTWIDISEAQGAQIVIDAIVETVIALIDHDCYNRIAGTVYYTESVIFRMSWLAHEAFAGLVVAVHVASEKSGLNGVSLADSLILRCLEGLQQLMKRNSECTASQS